MNMDCWSEIAHGNDERTGQRADTGDVTIMTAKAGMIEMNFIDRLLVPYDSRPLMATHCPVPRERPEDGSSRLHDAIDWSTGLEKFEDSEPGGSCSEMLERMSAQNRANRIDFLVKEFQQLGQRVEGRSGRMRRYISAGRVGESGPMREKEKIAPRHRAAN